MVIVITENVQLRAELADKEVGFIPTMGALHPGHISLVKESVRRGLFTVVSIFVNPTQFNSQKDFDLYPMHLEQDYALLREADCDVVFVPSIDQVYPQDLNMERYQHTFGSIDSILEGKFRPGHFKGVAQVVHRLFEIVRPRVAIFGEKDFQQLAIIHQLNRKLKLPIEIVGMPTLREKNGLAMSSRNERLSPAQKEAAGLIYEGLVFASQNYETDGYKQTKDQVVAKFDENKEWTLEYFDLVYENTFESAETHLNGDVRAVIAAILGGVRLIDNLRIT